MELGGDGAEAHPSLHPAERYPAGGKSLHAAMVEVLCNVTPAAMVVDELRDSEAAKAAAAVGNHGVQLIATAHAETLAELVNNKAMAPVLGDFEECTLSDREAMRRSGAQRWGNFSKVRNQRIGEATFDAVVELRPPSCSRDAWRVILDVNGAIDAIVEKMAVRRRAPVLRRAPRPAAGALAARAPAHFHQWGNLSYAAGGSSTNK